MKRLRSILLVAFIFGCGFFVGGFLGAAVGWVGFFHKVVKGGPAAVRSIIVQRATDDLRLKPEQRTAVKKIVDETALELGTATTEVRPKVEEIMGRGETRVREVLNDEQRKKFDGFANQGRRRWKEFQEKRDAELKTALAPVSAPEATPELPPEPAPRGVAKPAIEPAHAIPAPAAPEAR